MRHGRGWAVAILWMAIGATAGTGQEREEHPIPQGIEVLELEGVSGDVVVLPAEAGSARIVLEADVEPAGAFRGTVETEGTRMVLEEDWGPGRSSGSVRWTFFLPPADAPRLRIGTASGDLEMRDVAAKVDFRTASGGITLTAVELAGDSRFRTASGDYRLADLTLPDRCRLSTASGDFIVRGVRIGDGCRLSSASGDLDLSESVPGDGMELSSASGNVRVVLDQLPPQGFEASSASGDVTLEVERLGADYRLVLIAREHAGSIRTPLDYTAERTFFRDDGRDEVPYMEKIVERGTGHPEFRLSTASGEVRVRTGR